MMAYEYLGLTAVEVYTALAIMFLPFLVVAYFGYQYIRLMSKYPPPKPPKPQHSPRLGKGERAVVE